MGHQAQNLHYENFQKRRVDLITVIISAKVYKKSDKQIKKPPKHIIPIHFNNKGLEFFHLNFILHENDIINFLPESLQEHEIPSTLYSFSNTIRNNFFNYKNIVHNINTNHTRTYGTGMFSCNCSNFNSTCTNPNPNSNQLMGTIYLQIYG